MQAEWAFVFVKFSQWCWRPKYARKGWQFQFQWLCIYVHRAVV